MSKQLKTTKELEKYFKGAANHRRISILLLVIKHPGISLDEISQNLDCNLKTIAEHTRRLVLAGLVNKHHAGNRVEHRASHQGKLFYKFMRTL